LKLAAAMLCCGLLSASNGLESRCTHSVLPSFRWSECLGGALWVIETRGPIEPFFSATDVPTLRARAQRSPRSSLLVNGGYHDGHYAEPRLEGLLSIRGKIVGALKAGDVQLTHVMSIDSAGRIASFRAADPGIAGRLEANHSHVQSGPLILDGGKIAVAAIEQSLNGNDPYKRTAIGRTATGETIIVVAKTPQTLANLARLVLRINDYGARRLTLLNLDGGPSTAIHSNQSPRLSYGADKITPVGFVVR
jgi:hypothetical protein